MSSEYVFEDKNELVKYLHAVLENPTQIKVQKTLYLLYAFYGASYGQLYKDDTKENEFSNENYPKYLFEGNFQAWRYGPVDIDVYRDEKQGFFDNIEEYELTICLPKDEQNNVLKFIGSITGQTNKIDDFSLVDRTHQDKSWKDIYKEGSRYIPMNGDDIIKEYKENYI